MPPVPPVSPTAFAAREPTAIAAPFSRAWDAVIDDFAARNIPIRTMERASGFIATDRLAVPSDPRKARQPDAYADCGRDMLGTYGQPTEATYNVLVRGDSSRSTVRVTVMWTGDVAAAGGKATCTSRGTWEGELEGAIRQRAEGTQASRAP